MSRIEFWIWVSLGFGVKSLASPINLSISKVLLHHLLFISLWPLLLLIFESQRFKFQTVHSFRREWEHTKKPIKTKPLNTNARSQIHEYNNLKENATQKKLKIPSPNANENIEMVTLYRFRWPLLIPLLLFQLCPPIQSTPIPQRPFTATNVLSKQAQPLPTYQTATRDQR